MCFSSLEEALKHYPDAYVAMVTPGTCRVCKKEKDLRCGACFDCGAQVTGEPAAGGKAHKLWEIGKPDDFWYVPA